DNTFEVTEENCNVCDVTHSHWSYDPQCVGEATTCVYSKLLVHYTFEDRDEEEDKVLDMSGWQRHGTIQGSPTFVSSDWGEAISLHDVDDYITFSGIRNSSLYPDNSFTLSAHMRVDESD